MNESQSAALKRIESDAEAGRCIAKLAAAGCDSAWILDVLALLPIGREFVRAWRDIAGKGRRKLKRTLLTIREAIHEIARVRDGLPLQVSVVFHRHPSVPLLDHAQNLGAENLPWLLSEYCWLLRLLDRLAGKGRAEIVEENPIVQLQRVMSTLWAKGKEFASLEPTDDPGVFICTLRDGTVRRIRDKPPPPPPRPRPWPEFQDLAQWALVLHVKKATGRFHDSEVSYLIGCALDKPEYDENAHRVWRHENSERLDASVKALGVLPGTRHLFGSLLKT